ncbi:uncharacterized protein LOC127243021 isoform X2 [Andrographis paniculata]|uniref:uncharacterized protein LOC127243021 isoform X2 n=1 Tax=Andrographis paniculata TaxID=175694 RepID=UPI0021E95E59|nr:uncharacterized protein LOC127243021 isoform X2 [Andrographis paniculata]
MGPKKCEVCDDAQSKYKCPACLVPYCSLACFKKHKETPCAKPEPLKEEISHKSPDASHSAIEHPTAAKKEEKPCYVGERREVLQESQLRSVAASNEIRDAIKDEKLQKLICNIDSSTDPDNELDKAMEDETFLLFTEKILSTIGK